MKKERQLVKGKLTTNKKYRLEIHKIYLLLQIFNNINNISYFVDWNETLNNNTKTITEKKQLIESLKLGKYKDKKTTASQIQND